MTVEELNNLIILGRNRSALISRECIVELPGVVRDIQISANNTVTISYNNYGELDSGPRFTSRYPTLPSLVSDIEKFIGGRMSEWSNISSYPPRLETWPPILSPNPLLGAIRAGNLPLPTGAKYELPKGSYWETQLR